MAESHPGQHGVNRSAEANRPIVHLPPAGGEGGQVRKKTKKTGNYIPQYTLTVASQHLSRVTEEVTTKLLKSSYHQIERDGILATRLCTHKDDVELTNENKLKQLPGAIFGIFQVFIELAPVETHQTFIQWSVISVLWLLWSQLGDNELNWPPLLQDQSVFLRLWTATRLWSRLLMLTPPWGELSSSKWELRYLMCLLSRCPRDRTHWFTSTDVPIISRSC